MMRDDPCWQVTNVLSRILLCRTATLKGRLYRCQECQHELNMYNSCTDRHCPQCGGARRADWLDSTAKLLLPQLDYFQVVFTLPEDLSKLALGNRRLLYDLLFHSAWRALDQTLRQSGRFQPAALMVLHTWNQELGHHPHVHALAPGGGPSLDGSHWVTSRHPTQRRRKHPYLVDVAELGRTFRDNYLSGLKRLLAKSLLKTEGSQAWLQDKSRQDAWLSELQELDWNVFIQGPPHAQSDPAHVLKYLARYMTGGPISNHRILGADEDNAWFMARSRDKRNKSRPFKLRGSEFVRRWAMHILPRGYTRSRSYGGFHSRKRRTYLQLCKTLLPPQPEEHEPTAAIPNACEPEAPKCRRCRKPLTLVLDQPRPSWKTIFTRTIYEDASLYSPKHQISARAPPASPDV